MIWRIYFYNYLGFLIVFYSISLCECQKCINKIDDVNLAPGLCFFIVDNELNVQVDVKDILSSKFVQARLIDF